MTLTGGKSKFTDKLQFQYHNAQHKTHTYCPGIEPKVNCSNFLQSTRFPNVYICIKIGKGLYPRSITVGNGVGYNTGYSATKGKGH